MNASSGLSDAEELGTLSREICDAVTEAHDLANAQYGLMCAVNELEDPQFARGGCKVGSILLDRLEQLDQLAGRLKERLTTPPAA